MHGDGCMTTAFMVRQGNYKLVHYVGYPPQLFDLALDPYEKRDLASRHETADIQGRLYDALHGIVDPDAANRLAFADQRARIEQLGGAEAILARPDFNFTPLTPLIARARGGARFTRSTPHRGPRRSAAASEPPREWRLPPPP